MKKLLAVTLVFVAMLSVAYGETSKSKSADEYLADLSSDKEESAIIEAAEWAGDKKKKEAVDKLVVLLDDERENVRLYAVMALGYIADEKGAEAVNKTLLGDESSEVRYAALLSSFRIGSKKSIDAWKEAKEKDTDPVIQDLLTKLEQKASKEKK